MQDNEILDLYFKRDEDAVTETKIKYNDFLHALSLNILKLNEDAEECVSDTYWKAWNSIPPQRPDHFKFWLGRVTKNLSINLYNKNHASKRYCGIELILDELSECIPSPNDTAKETEVNELTEILNRWLSSLPKEKRKLFLRRYWFGIEVKDLAKEKGIRSSYISKELFNLRKALKDKLTKEGYLI